MQRISKKDRHVRGNWEKSPDLPDVEGIEAIRYHFVIVDDRDREGILRRILDQIQKISAIVMVREGIIGKVKGTRLKYLFATYDTYVAPRELDLTKARKPVKRDEDLRERKEGSGGIEDYVANLYEG